MLSVPLLSAATLLSPVCVISLLSLDLCMVRVLRGKPLRRPLCSPHWSASIQTGRMAHWHAEKIDKRDRCNQCSQKGAKITFLGSELLLFGKMWTDCGWMIGIILWTNSPSLSVEHSPPPLLWLLHINVTADLPVGEPAQCSCFLSLHTEEGCSVNSVHTLIDGNWLAPSSAFVSFWFPPQY